MCFRSGVLASRDAEELAKRLSAIPFIVSHGDFSPFKEQHLMCVRGKLQWPAGTGRAVREAGIPEITPPQSWSEKALPEDMLLPGWALANHEDEWSFLLERSLCAMERRSGQESWV